MSSQVRLLPCRSVYRASSILLRRRLLQDTRCFNCRSISGITVRTCTSTLYSHTRRIASDGNCMSSYLSRGLGSIRVFKVEKYEASIFGVCPRVYCLGCNVVPCGRSDLPGLDTVKLFCPNCNDIYIPPSSRFQGVDGNIFTCII